MTFFTARQLEQMHKAGGGTGRIVLPYGSRLTPMAQDFLRAKKIGVGYAESGSESKTAAPGVVDSRQGGSQYIWWTDGPSGAAKAAITTQARETLLTALEIANDENHLVPAIKAIAGQIKTSQSVGAVLLVKNAARAGVFANRCPSIRAVLGTCLDAVEQGISLVAANVLIVEYPYKTFPQIRNLLSRFVRGSRALSPETEQQLKEMATCA